jgi:Skp family chaperone for outer membrane proteins
MSKTVFGVLAVVAALSFAQGDAKKRAILVIDLQACVDQCDESKERVNSLEKERKAKEEAFAGQVRELKAKQEELQRKNLSERDAHWHEEILALLRQKGEIEAQAASYSAKVADDIARLLQGLLLDARKASESIRKERGADMVFVSKLGPISLDDKKQVSEEYVVRRVLAYPEEADITAEAVKRMNAAYADRKK